MHLPAVAQPQVALLADRVGGAAAQQLVAADEPAFDRRPQQPVAVIGWAISISATARSASERPKR